MAVTKIWPVKGRLDAVIRYAGNEEKTRLPDLTGLSAGKDDLSDVLQYAANDAKTSKESQLFVSGVNCVPEIARQQMELTKQQFGKTGGTVAFHAYQSFHPGEVTPEQCHAIGVELAKRVWGDRFSGAGGHPPEHRLLPQSLRHQLSVLCGRQAVQRLQKDLPYSAGRLG